MGEVRTSAGRDINASMLADVDVLLVRSVTSVNEELLTGTSVKFVGSATSGLDHIDRQYLKNAGIEFTYAPGANANSVVEYVLAAIAAIEKKLEQLFSGGSVGIVGYGHVGKALARTLRALEIDIRICDPWLDMDDVSENASLDEVLKCDVVTLHCELTDEQPWPSHYLLDETTLVKLADNALLINASRGSVIDNNALLARLKQRLDLRVALDVWEGEPTLNSKLLRAADLGTAHIAGYSLDGKQEATRMLHRAAVQHFSAGVVASINPKQNESGANKPLTTAASVLSPADLVRHLIQAKYDIRQDDALLRQATANKESADSAAGFDRLRKTYRDRRELAGSPVDYSGEHMSILRALGCQLLQGPA